MRGEENLHGWRPRGDSLIFDHQVRNPTVVREGGNTTAYSCQTNSVLTNAHFDLFNIILQSIEDNSMIKRNLHHGRGETLKKTVPRLLR